MTITVAAYFSIAIMATKTAEQYVRSVRENDYQHKTAYPYKLSFKAKGKKRFKQIQAGITNISLLKECLNDVLSEEEK